VKILDPSVTFRWVTPDADAEIASAARLCYQSDESGKSDQQMLEHIIKLGHLSVVEHGSASYQVVADRGWTHEAVRSRIGVAYSQESTRYCNYTKERLGGEIKVIPMLDGLNVVQKDRRRWLYEHMERVYREEIAEGIKPQQARDNLPTCLKTEIRMTFTFRAWMHFFELRCAPAAHPQMQKVAKIIFEDLAARSLTLRIWAREQPLFAKYF
jgi:thymidylate synthase (FAD)